MAYWTDDLIIIYNELHVDKKIKTKLSND